LDVHKLPSCDTSLAVHLDIPPLIAVPCLASAMSCTARSDPPNIVVNTGFRLWQKELKLPGENGLLGVQVCSA